MFQFPSEMLPCMEKTFFFSQQLWDLEADLFIDWVVLEFPHFCCILGQLIVLTATCKNYDSVSEQWST